jgi:1,4-alpha-glucan branching enzyme
VASGFIPNAPRNLADDGYLKPYWPALMRRGRQAAALAQRLTGGSQSLADFASGHEYFGLHRDGAGWVFREWAPNATAVCILCDRAGWQETAALHLRRRAHGQWEGRFPAEQFDHGALYRLRLWWNGGQGDRIPAYARRVVQDPHTGIFNAQVWEPERPYPWRHESPPPAPAVLVYECHVGMALEEARVGSYAEFQTQVLPRICAAGYNTVQLMAVLEHPYYGSFGYHVSSYFAASSRCGTPDELKGLIDAAHGLGLRVVIDLVHSHAVRNETEGLARFDGTPIQYFHEGPRGQHPAWGSCCFDYAKPEVLHFLLSNCRFWLDEFHVDGFRFDGVTSMLYLHHGLGRAFTSYADYFGAEVDEDAVAYLTLANEVIHRVRPDAITIAEDVSGLPGLAAPRSAGGVGFDYRLAMGVTDMWFRMLDLPDEAWPLGHVWHELTNRRQDERTISYAECHDQAIVGGQTLIFRLIRDGMYDAMHRGSTSLTVDRGMALHKMIRLATAATASHGYLAFMGNEFGHPEWIDFPREGNQWSLHHARRLWSLRDDESLRYGCLAAFDAAMLALLWETGLLWRARPQVLRINEIERVVAFERAGVFFFFNLHPTQSYSDYEIEVLPGEYVHLLDTDQAEFGGFARLWAGQSYATTTQRGDGVRHDRLRLYLPARTALVLRRVTGEDGAPGI